MIEPISIGIIILGGALFVVLWPQIVHLFSTTIIPWVREVISDGVADSLATIICFADNRMVGTRSQIKSAYKTFKKTLLGCKSTYEKMDANAVTRKTFTIIRDPSG